MSLGNTETSSEVPVDYNGILDPKVVSDENNNVTELPVVELPGEEGFTEEEAAAYNGYYERRRALEDYSHLIVWLPEASRPTTLEGLLEGVETVRAYLEGEKQVQ